MSRAIPSIGEEEHGLLLYRLSNITGSDEKVRRLEKDLQEGLARYHELLGELEKTVSAYMEAAKKAKGLP